MSGRVCIIQGVVKQYRYAFFIGLYERLKADGIRLQVLYSEPNALEAKKGDNVELPVDVGTKIRGRWFLNERMSYQAIWPHVAQADLVIVEQANKYVMTHLLVAMSLLGLKRVAFWGHGRNRQGGGRASEWLKRRYVKAVSWWFAYTQGVARYVEAAGFAHERITAVMNGVDTSAFREQLAAVSPQDTARVRNELGLESNARIALYCGGLYADKRIPFLLEAARLVAARIPGFRLIVIGAGADAARLAAAADELPWLHYVGPKFGADRAVYFRLAELFLCPGLVGLAILDAFAAGLPLMTTDIPIHSPEIEYLENGMNGVMTEHRLDAYADKIVGLLGDHAAMARMRAGAYASAKRYSIDEMVGNFRNGILASLGRG